VPIASQPPSSEMLSVESMASFLTMPSSCIFSPTYIHSLVSSSCSTRTRPLPLTNHTHSYWALPEQSSYHCYSWRRLLPDFLGKDLTGRGRGTRRCRILLVKYDSVQHNSGRRPPAVVTASNEFVLNRVISSGCTVATATGTHHHSCAIL
jgi:hypothetical protein